MSAAINNCALGRRCAWGIIETVPQDAAEIRSLVTLGRLTRGAMHELANPLVALLGSAELALGDTEPGTKLHDRISLTQRTGAEVVEIVRALQAFIRLQPLPPEELSVGAAAADAAALVTRVVPTHDVELHTSGDATTVARPGELRSRLVELILDALEAPGRGPVVELVVADGLVTVTGGGELRL
jgi:signal transduction histidine kinase